MINNFQKRASREKPFILPGRVCNFWLPQRASASLAGESSVATKAVATKQPRIFSSRQCFSRPFHRPDLDAEGSRGTRAEKKSANHRWQTAGAGLATKRARGTFGPAAQRGSQRHRSGFS